MTGIIFIIFNLLVISQRIRSLPNKIATKAEVSTTPSVEGTTKFLSGEKINSTANHKRRNIINDDDKFQKMLQDIFGTADEWYHKSPISTRSPSINTNNHSDEIPNRKTSDQIIFPDDKKFFPPNRSCDELKTLCETVANYPKETINRKLAEKPYLKLLLVNEEPIIETKSRFGSGNDNPLCFSTQKTIFPKKAETQHGEWLDIVNDEENIQGVRVEVCKHDESPCRMIGNNFLDGWQAVCEQKYMYRQLLAIHNNELGQAFVKIPSTCCCTMKFVSGSDLSLRMNSHRVSGNETEKKK